MLVRKCPLLHSYTLSPGRARAHVSRDRKKACAELRKQAVRPRRYYTCTYTAQHTLGNRCWFRIRVPATRTFWLRRFAPSGRGVITIATSGHIIPLIGQLDLILLSTYLAFVTTENNSKKNQLKENHNSMHTQKISNYNRQASPVTHTHTHPRSFWCGTNPRHNLQRIASHRPSTVSRSPLWCGRRGPKAPAQAPPSSSHHRTSERPPPPPTKWAQRKKYRIAAARVSAQSNNHLIKPEPKICTR